MTSDAIMRKQALEAYLADRSPATLERVSVRLGVSPQCLRHYYAYRAYPALLRALGIDLSYLLEEAPPVSEVRAVAGGAPEDRASCFEGAPVSQRRTIDACTVAGTSSTGASSRG